MIYHTSHEVVGVDIFPIINNTLPCIIDYYSKFPIVQKVDGLSADDLISAAKIVFAECGLPKKIISDTVITSIPTTLNNFVDSQI